MAAPGWIFFLRCVSHECAAAFRARHFVRGVSGQPFQSPFANPPGKGLSSTVNVVWGFFNLVIAYLLVCRVGEFALDITADVVPFGAGMLAMGLFMAQHFGTLHGGNAPASR